MRQTGILAAAGLYALDNNVERLRDDHRRAAQLANNLSVLTKNQDAQVKLATNMVWFTPPERDFSSLAEFLASRGILVGVRKPVMRIVVHLGIADEDIEIVSEAFLEFYRSA